MSRRMKVPAGADLLETCSLPAPKGPGEGLTMWKTLAYQGHHADKATKLISESIGWFFGDEILKQCRLETDESAMSIYVYSPASEPRVKDFVRGYRYGAVMGEFHSN